MGKDVLIMFFGFLAALLPFLGFPSHFDTYILVFLGVSIIALGILVRREDHGREARTYRPETYEESEPQAPIENEHEHIA